MKKNKKDQYDGKTKSGGLFPVGTDGSDGTKKRTLDELRQVKTYGYMPPSPSKEKDKNDKK